MKNCSYRKKPSKRRSSKKIKSKSKRKSSRQLFVLEKDVLGKFGYHNIKISTQHNRHKALNKALKYLNPLSLARRLNALYVLNKNVDPPLAQIFKKDELWIKTTKAYLHRNQI